MKATPKKNTTRSSLAKNSLPKKEKSAAVILTQEKIDAAPSQELTLLAPFINEVSGARGVSIVQSIGDGATDETIEQKTHLKIAEIRSILNHLHSYGVVEYTREKNMTSGWFTYTWRVNTNRALQNFFNLKRREYAAFRSQLTEDENTLIYSCKGKCGRFPFDTALEAKFKCPSCGSNLKELDCKKELSEIEQKIAILEKIKEISASKPIFSGSGSNVKESINLLKKAGGAKTHAARLLQTKNFASNKGARQF